VEDGKVCLELLGALVAVTVEELWMVLFGAF
jgi:hypothetical protein